MTPERTGHGGHGSGTPARRSRSSGSAMGTIQNPCIQTSLVLMLSKIGNLRKKSPQPAPPFPNPGPRFT